MNSIKFVTLVFNCIAFFHPPGMGTLCENHLSKFCGNFVGICCHLPGVGTAEGTVAMVPLADGLSSNFGSFINDNIINVGKENLDHPIFDYRMQKYVYCTSIYVLEVWL